MERFILTLTHGDGCTYSCDEVIPIEYESKEALYCDLNDIVKAGWLDKDEFMFAGRQLFMSWFDPPYDEMTYGHGKKPYPTGKIIHEPIRECNILTVDEWFEQGKV